jgi:alkylated DNA nucleotide flippase Atl1
MELAVALGLENKVLSKEMSVAGIRIRDWRKPFVCSCGQKIVAPKQGHLTSILHRKSENIVALLKTSVSYSEIGRLVGVSRERVRQIAELLSIKRSRNLSWVCAFERFKKCRPVLAAVAEELRQKGLQVEGVRSHATWSRRLLIVNGKRCAVSKSWRTQFHGMEYFQIGPCCKAAAFTLRRTPYGWLVLPKNAVTKSTMFVLGRRKLNGAGGPKHDWGKYLEAWHLLVND